MHTIQIGLLGLGTVGGGSVNVLQRNQNEISRRLGATLQVEQVLVRDREKKRLCSTTGLQLTESFDEILRNDDISIIVELIGGIEPAKEWILKAIDCGKHVVTANKALIAKHGAEIMACAQQNNVMVNFEPAVAGGIPIIKVLSEGLAANRIDNIVGIINGTANYILTEMSKSNRKFNNVLQDAKAKGYAEADPILDIAGGDMAHKLTILASLAFGIPLQLDKVYQEGIEHITPTDIRYAERFGYLIKPLGIARRKPDGIEMRVHPALITKDQLLSHVDGVMNAVLIEGDAVGSTLYYGAGAGAEPTASAVIAGIIEVARHIINRNSYTASPVVFSNHNDNEHLSIISMEKIMTANYLRLEIADKIGVLSEVTNLLASNHISIKALLQEDHQTDNVPVVIMTHSASEKNINDAVEKIRQLAGVEKNIIRIRVE